MEVICSLIIVSVSLPKDNLDIIFKGKRKSAVSMDAVQCSGGGGGGDKYRRAKGLSMGWTCKNCLCFRRQSLKLIKVDLSILNCHSAYYKIVSSGGQKLGACEHLEKCGILI